MYLVRLLRQNAARNDMRIMYNQTMTDEQLSNLPRQKIAMLIDGDNAQPSLLPQMLVEGSALWTGHCQTNLRRLDDGQHEFLERDVELPRLSAHPAVPLHHRQERHR